jgi:hypothetical protein
LREVRLGCLEDEVKVIRHQHPCGDGPTEPPHGLGKETEKGFAVPIGAKDRSLFIAATGDVIESVRKLES